MVEVVLNAYNVNERTTIKKTVTHYMTFLMRQPIFPNRKDLCQRSNGEYQEYLRLKPKRLAQSFAFLICQQHTFHNLWRVIHELLTQAHMIIFMVISLWSLLSPFLKHLISQALPTDLK